MNKFTKDYFTSAFKRAFHTFWEVFASMLVVGMGFGDADFANIFSVSGLAAVLSLAKSFAVGIPEEKIDGEVLITDDGESRLVLDLNHNIDLDTQKKVLFVVGGKDSKDEEYSSGLTNKCRKDI